MNARERVKWQLSILLIASENACLLSAYADEFEKCETFNQPSGLDCEGINANVKFEHIVH